MILAKSENSETLRMHTDLLLENLILLRSLHPNPETVDWDVLKIACEYHDLGKMNSIFQYKIKQRIKGESCEPGILKNEVPHNYLSTAFIDTKKWKVELGKQRLKVLINAIAYHHERGPYDADKVKAQIDDLKKASQDYENGKYQPYKPVSYSYLNNNHISEEDVIFDQYVLVKGFLNRLDYAASGHMKVEQANDFLLGGLESFRDCHHFEWNALQEYMLSHQDENVVVVAETGMGKTEGALLWIGDHKGFFTLPLKTAINAIYDRIRTQIVPSNRLDYVSLLHSDAKAILSSENEDLTKYQMTRMWSEALTISTVDQIFKFVFRHQNFEANLATVSMSKIVIDEIQMYDPSLLAYLIYGLKMLNHYGGQFAILTATFPTFLYSFMRSKGIEFEMPLEAFTKNHTRHHLKVINDDFDYEEILALSVGKKSLVICNTVKMALDTYEALKNISPDSCIKLLHSRFIKEDRKQKENEILSDAKNTKPVIWVSTQIVEASLDIDFDVLFTELSDLSGLFQRLGRCNRKGLKSIDQPNCYVFLGHSKCSGVGTIIDETIHELSKAAIIEHNGILEEIEKMDLVNKVYDETAIKGSKYYKKFIESYRALEDTCANQMSKKEVDQMFRKIDTFAVIPSPIYEANQEEIDALVSDYRAVEGQKESYAVRFDIFEKLNQYKVSIRPYEQKYVDAYITLEGKKDMMIGLLTCDYDYERGLVILKQKAEEGNMDF